MAEQSQASYEKTPQGWASLWKVELTAARKSLAKWQERSEKIIKRFSDERSSGHDGSYGGGDTRLNLFTANIQTIGALIYGKTPSCMVQRKFADSEDDVARVAAEMFERLLNTEIEYGDDGYKMALRQALMDRLLPGLGNCRVRYETEFETVPGQPAMQDETGAEIPNTEVPESEQLTEERVCVDYINWKDQLWNPARTFSEVRWWAFRTEMSREDLKKRFGEKGATIPLNAKKATGSDDGERRDDPWSRAEIWEIWSREHRKVFWVSEGSTELLDEKDDPLELDGFWPFPQPMWANLTTSKLIPTPDYVIAQDLYEQCDNLQTRISLLEDALRVAGVYDKNNDGVKRLISETRMNELIGVDGWGAFAEKGGVKGAIDWLPIEQIASTLEVLQGRLNTTIQLLYQVTGMSDIMRGQANEQTTATEQAIKARFASVRVQFLQDEFAMFASEVQRIKAEIISKHFQPQTIIENSNIMNTPDAQYAQQAVELMKSKYYEYRVTVNPDAVSMTDFAALKQERFEWVQSLSGFMQAMMPVVQVLGPPATPYMLKIAQWAMAGLRGSNEIEGVFDEAIVALEKQQQMAAMQPPQPPPPDPKLQAAQVKAQAEGFKAKAAIMQSGMDLKATQQKTALDMQMAQQKHAMDMQSLAARHITDMQANEAEQRKAAIDAVKSITPGGGI